MGEDPPPITRLGRCAVMLMCDGNALAVIDPPQTRPDKDPPVVMFDPVALSPAQLLGDACVSCGKHWPRPRMTVGTVPASTLPGARYVKACEECAEGVAFSLHRERVRLCLEYAARDAGLFGSDVVSALLCSMPLPYGEAARRALTAAMVLVACHIQATEDIPGDEQLPTKIDSFEVAYTWLQKWRGTDPPTAVITEVLQAVLASLTGIDSEVIDRFAPGRPCPPGGCLG